MRKIKLYIAISLNGKIANSDGSVDWLELIPKPTDTDYGYNDFYENIDTTIQGYSTYNQIMGWKIDFPYSGKINYVFTRKSGLENTKDVEFISENHVEFIKDLKNKEGKDIWLIGGGKLNTSFLNENLINELIVFIMPIILNNGIELFEGLPKETILELVTTKKYSTGVVELKYKL